ncbi:MAG: hypothetical protein FWC27_02275, partial [Firmicutes bacterium]|nr:hypothetical protein [Bacillota bacterium]
MFCSTNRSFCCCRQNSCQQDCCCRQNCCCPRCCGPRTVFGAAQFFDEARPYLADIVTYGDLTETGYKDVTVPLNRYNPLIGVGGSGGSLVTQSGGLYELRYSLVAQYLPTVPFEVFVGKTVGDVTAPIEETVQTVGNSLFALGLEEPVTLEEEAVPAVVPASAPLPPVLLPRFISKTAQVRLEP